MSSVHNKLFADAADKQKNFEIIQKRAVLQQGAQPAPISLNVKSKAYYVSKFTKEIVRMWSGISAPKETKENEILSKELTI